MRRSSFSAPSHLVSISISNLINYREKREKENDIHCDSCSTLQDLYRTRTCDPPKKVFSTKPPDFKKESSPSLTYTFFLSIYVSCIL